MAKTRYFHAHETARLDALEGLPLAGFWQRVEGFGIDAALWFCLVAVWRGFDIHLLHGHTTIEFDFDLHGPALYLLFLYLVLSPYFGNGRTPGKRIAGCRVVSLVHERLGLWQCVERVLGYGVSTAEGIGFAQYFWSTNRMCVQDRIAETIVVDVRTSARRLAKGQKEEPMMSQA